MRLLKDALANRSREKEDSSRKPARSKPFPRRC